MKYRQFGNTGIEVSEIGFGAWGIGGIVDDARAYGPTDDKVSSLALRNAFDLGINFYDTSPLYGYGHSEEIIGASLKNVRQNIIIASKVGYVNFKGEQDFSPKYIRESLESSLRRLQTDYVDILQLHDPPFKLLQQNNGVMELLNNLVREGKIRVAGVSVRSPNEDIVAIEQLGFKSLQVNYSLVDQRAMENGILARCKESGIGVINRTPLCFGFLTGKYSVSDDYDVGDHRRMWSRGQIERWANAYKLFAGELDKMEKQTHAQIALRFCLSSSAVSTVIPGMLTPEHVVENARSSQLSPFAKDILERFDKIYQGNEFFVKPDLE